jgi:hypothetical protein
MKIFVGILNWGLGHATRSVPIIRALLTRNAEVHIGSDGLALTLLRQEFPHIRCIELPSYNIRYSRYAWQMPVTLLLQVPGMYAVMKEEHRLMQNLSGSERYDLIISDNRYGIYHPEHHSVWLGHQLSMARVGIWTFLSPLFDLLHHRLLHSFSGWWVPDLPGSVLSGSLSHTHLPVNYVGLLSRFRPDVDPPETIYPIVVLLSGPEPQRSLLEEKIRKQLPALPVRSLLIRGVNGTSRIHSRAGYDEADFADKNMLNRFLRFASLVVCRSGYSTIMDLCCLGKKALFIPTPGQPEQEYLARRFASQGVALMQKQHRIDLGDAWNQLDRISGFDVPPQQAYLDQVLDQFMK